MMTPIDVAIIGGGPAGAVAARLLAVWGFDVLLLTRPPHHQPLVESLPPSITKLLDRVGIGEAVDHAGFLRSSGNTVWWGQDDTRTEYFDSGQLGYQVPRARFDHLLLDQVAAAGATVHRQAIVRGVEPAGDADALRVVTYDADQATRQVRARWVLDCTGRAGLTARGGWRRSEPGLRTTALVATWEQENWPLPDVSHTLVESYGAGWAWSVPESSSRRQVAVMIDPVLTPVRGAAGLLERYRAELARTRRLSTILAGARMVGTTWARDASPYTAHTTGQPGHLLAGDAASFTDPLSSFGVKKALASGWLAAVVTRTSLEDPTMTAVALAFHHRRELEMADALRRRAAEFSLDATAAHAGEYWSRRLADTEALAEPGPDPATLREDPLVQAAFQALRAREHPLLRPAGPPPLARRPAVHADRIALEDQLLLPDAPDGLRWLRGVDLVTLATHPGGPVGIPQLFEASQRQNRSVQLPDFLGAVAFLLARGVLEFA